MTDARPRPLRIGLSARLMHRPPAELGFRDKTLQYLEQTMAHWVMSEGALAFMVPTLDRSGEVSRREVSVRRYVEALDGLVLQGGADVSPTSYGQTPLAPEWEGDRIRDDYEMELLWEFVAQGKPVLGVCRGAQLINVAMGGTLWQDIPSQLPEAARHVDRAHYERLHHDVDLVPGSRLAELYPAAATLRVTSIHHQAIRDLGRDLRVEARSSVDGVIEAIRWAGSGRVVGLQWHPEFHGHQPGLLDSTPILLDFLEAARERAA